MKVINNLLLICLCVLTIIFKHFAVIKQDYNHELIMLQQEKRTEVIGKIEKNIVNKINGDIRLVNVDIIKGLIDDKNLIEEINKYSFNGCFKIGFGEFKYSDIPCGSYVIDSTISSNPILQPGMLSVKKVDDKFNIVNYYDWYNYNELKFAYSIVLKSEDDAIVDNNIENLFVWIPAFYYDEDNDLVSFKPIDVIEKRYQKTTPKHLLRAFLLKNSELYGFWLQLDKNKIDKVTNGNSVDIHPITDDEKYAIELFQKYYGLDNNFFDINNCKVISIGKEPFLDE